MTSITVPTPTGTYAIDPTHSRIGFVARHAMVTKVRGSFNEFEGSGYFDAENPASSRLQLTIKAPSIDTRNADRDAHLRSNDFFDMENHPEITFVSSNVEHVDSENYRVTGDLTIKGVTKPVTVDLEYTGAAVDPFSEPADRLRRQGDRQPQGLGSQLERRPRGRRRARQREGDPRVGGIRHPHRRRLLTIATFARPGRFLRRPGRAPSP
jgi:polyisoprenoid-binding protein YceI